MSYERNLFDILQSIEEIDGLNTFIGYKTDDLNLPGNVLIVENSYKIYSFY